MNGIIGNRRLSDSPHTGAGVYFLFDRDNELLYVGMSESNCMGRVLSHDREGVILYSSYFIIPLPVALVKQVEAYLIASLKPRMNRLGVDDGRNLGLIKEYWTGLANRAGLFLDFFCDGTIDGFIYPCDIPVTDNMWVRSGNSYVVGRAGGRSFTAMTEGGNDVLVVHAPCERIERDICLVSIDGSANRALSGSISNVATLTVLEYLSMKSIEEIRASGLLFGSNSEFNEWSAHSMLFEFELDWLLSEFRAGNVLNADNVYDLVAFHSKRSSMPATGW